MPNRPLAADRRDREETAGAEYFAPLAVGGDFLVITPRPKGAPVSARVPGVVAGDRAYVRVWSQSGLLRRLRQVDQVQVTACSKFGLVSYGEPRYAAVRPLAGEAADRAAAQLMAGKARGPGVWARLLRRTPVYYELVVPWSPAITVAGM